MRFHSIRVRGISEAFRGEASLDFDALGPGLIAIVGQNGAGKSTLIGCLFASLFRQLPAQKRSLYDFATDQNPEIDVMFSVHDQRFRSLIRIDPQSRQMESYLFTAEGKALTNGKKDSFQEAIERLVGSRSFYEASIFSNQKRIGNFLSLDRAQRKELFVEQLLGMGRLRGLCALAKDKNEDLKKEILSLEGELKGLESPLVQQAELPTLTFVEEALEEVSNQLFGEEARFQEARQRLAEAQKQIGGLEALEKEFAEIKRREGGYSREREPFLLQMDIAGYRHAHLSHVVHVLGHLLNLFSQAGWQELSDESYLGTAQNIGAYLWRRTNLACEARTTYPGLEFPNSDRN
jgi:exonuclease SbcC